MASGVRWQRKRPCPTIVDRGHLEKRHRPTIDRVIPCRVASPQSPTPFHPAADRNDHAKEVQEQDHRSGTVKDDRLTCECLNKLGGPQLRAEMGPFCAPITKYGKRFDSSVKATRLARK